MNHSGSLLPEKVEVPKSSKTSKFCFPETPLKLLKDVFDALQLCDLVDLLEKEKPRTLRPSLPLRDIRKKPNYSNRPTRFYSKAEVLTIGTGTGQAQSYAQRIGSFLKDFNSRSKVTTISMKTITQICTVLFEWGKIKSIFELGLAGYTETRLKRQLQQLQKGLRAEEELKMKEELERYVETRKLKKKDRKLAIEKRMNQMMEELQTESEKFQMSLLDWKIRKGWLKLRVTLYLVRTCLFVFRLTDMDTQ